MQLLLIFLLASSPSLLIAWLWRLDKRHNERAEARKDAMIADLNDRLMSFVNRAYQNPPRLRLEPDTQEEKEEKIEEGWVPFS